MDATSGAGNDVRFDFSSMAILPDGGVVVVYHDSIDFNIIVKISYYTSITEEGPVRGGFDFQLSSSEKGRSIARELMVKYGGQVTETNKLVGRKDGRDLLRHTFGVRLPDVMVGDYLFLDESVWNVTRIDRRKANLRRLLLPISNKTVEVESLRNSPILDEPLETQVISHRDREYLLLDPFTFQTVEAISPENWSGDEVKALRYGNDTYFVWD